jgi:hypothetical protein
MSRVVHILLVLACLSVSSLLLAQTQVETLDTDGDGVNNAKDLDDDNDGIVDAVERQVVRYETCHRTLDCDGDLIPDNIEAQPTDQFVSPSGQDADGNGLDDVYQRCIPSDQPCEPVGLVPVDSDGDGQPDFIDPDTDNDGIPDRRDNQLAGPPAAGGQHSDADGLPSRIDRSRAAFGPTNGVLEGPLETGDSDNDHRFGGDVDFRDSSHARDTDGDGVPNVGDMDDDNDGLLDIVEGNEDFDGDTVPNHLDLDSDCDGVPDTIDAQAGTAIGLVDIGDANGDGLDDRFQSGTSIGVSPEDYDNDGSPDFLDSDSPGADAEDACRASEEGSGRYDVDRDGIADPVDPSPETWGVNGPLDMEPEGYLERPCD